MSLKSENNNFKLNIDVLKYINNCSVDKLQSFLSLKENDDKTNNYELALKIKKAFIKNFDSPLCFIESEEIDEDFLNKILKVELKDIEALDVVISAILAKFYMSGKKEIKDFFSSDFMDEKFFKLVSMAVCKKIMDYFFEFKFNDSSNAFFTNPFSSLVLGEFLNDTPEKPLELYDLNAKAFSYEVEYNIRKSDFESVESADLVFFNRFISDNSLLSNYKVCRQINFFDLNEFLINNTQDDSYLNLKSTSKELDLEDEEEIIQNNISPSFFQKAKKIVNKIRKTR